LGTILENKVLQKRKSFMKISNFFPTLNLFFSANVGDKIQIFNELKKLSYETVEKQTMPFLNIRIFGGQSPGNTARHADSHEQKDDDSNSYTGGGSRITKDELFKRDEASSRVDPVS